MDKINKFFQKEIKDEKKLMLFVIVCTFVWGLVAHAYAFFQNSFSHDMLNAFVATKTEDIFKLQIGRFFVVPYRVIFRGDITLPWLVGLLGIVWTSIAVYLVVLLLKTKSPIIIALISGIMVTNITYISQIATYMHEFDVNALALMLSVAAAYFWRRGWKVWNVVLGIVSLLLSLGIYQAYITVPMVLVLWLSISDLLEEVEIKKVLKNLIRAMIILLCSGLLYFVAGKVLYAIVGTKAMNRTTVYLFKNGKFLLPYYIKLIVPGIKQLIQTILHAAYSRTTLCAIMGVTLVATGVSFLYTWIKKELGLKRILVIGVLAGLIPFVMCTTFFLARGRDVHDLMWYSAWFVYVFILLVAFWIREQEIVSEKVGNWICIISCALVVFILSQNIILANTAYMKKTIEADATLSTMTRVVARMEEQEEYVLGETPVAFIGVGEVYDSLPGFESASYIKGLATNMSVSQDTSLYYYNAYKAYFDFVLNYPIELVDDDTHAELKQNKEVEELPTFPQKGCMKMINGVLVVKMGEIQELHD